jgi:hypothetical protein
MEMRFGLGDGTQKSLEDCSKHFHVTRERIRQVGIHLFVFVSMRKYLYIYTDYMCLYINKIMYVNMSISV